MADDLISTETVYASDVQLTAAPPRPLNWIGAGIAAAIGIAAFCIVGLRTLHEFGVLYSFVYTPLFAVPLMIELWRQGQIRWLGALYFLVGIAAAHGTANYVGREIYGAHDGFFCRKIFVDAPVYDDPVVQKACVDREVAERKAVALPAGAAGGATGALLSLLGLLAIGRRFRTGRHIAVMAVSTLVLTGIGALGFSFAFPDLMTRLQWVVQVFLPWQVVFAATLLALFDERVMGRPGTPPRWSAR